MQATDLIIFDCDGVLADSEVISADVIVAELARVGIALDHAYVFSNFVGKSFPGVAANIRASFATPLPEDFEDRYRSALAQAFATRLQPTPGLHAMLDALHLPACVATSSSPRRVALTLQRLGLSDRFGPHVFTASQVARGKPAPDLFLFAAAQMQADPARCLVIEDSSAGIAAAQAAGMRVFRYTGGAHFTDPRARPPDTPAGITVFDNWADFPLLEPQSVRNLAARHGASDG